MSKIYKAVKDFKHCFDGINAVEIEKGAELEIADEDVSLFGGNVKPKRATPVKKKAVVKSKPVETESE